ncbi:S8 family peptidase [Paenibacillus pasadenensis]|uniref:S8 family peptidase n=1 Tax=Paenibacillus pasadenensis TaxID=217090 RepID=UPI00203B0173|nr:S8 family peptidase [Paenibacillus pasadenensis]MCM3749432.1 S8 family peptidase [Paenibacillus pasadenensis]
MLEWHMLLVALLAGAGGIWWLAEISKGWLAEWAMPEHEQGELIVKFQEGLTADAKHRIHKQCACRVTEEKSGTGQHIVRAQKGRCSARKLKERYDQYPEVEYAEPNYWYRSCLVPQDSYYNLQYGPKLIGAEQAWDVTTGSGKVTIAVIDTGIDAAHPDLAGKVLEGRNFSGPAQDTADPNGHGTHVSGIAAAEINNGVGIAGIAPGVRLLPVRVLDAEGNGKMLNIADGIRYAADRGAQVINLSLGGPARSSTLRAAVRYAVAKGAVVVAAAGNTGSAAPVYPAAYDEVIAVGSIGETGAPSPFSAYGSWVDLAAPGEHIVSTYLSGSYMYSSGTSMAAPHVAGTAALLAGLGLTGAEIRSKLLTTADRSVDHGSSWRQGRVNAGRAVSDAASERG